MYAGWVCRGGECVRGAGVAKGAARQQVALRYQGRVKREQYRANVRAGKGQPVRHARGGTGVRPTRDAARVCHEGVPRRRAAAPTAHGETDRRRVGAGE